MALGFVVILIHLSCGGCSSGNNGGENDGELSTITSATIDINNINSWQNIDPIIRDDAGDTTDDSVDIESVFMAQDSDYFYCRIDLVGIVDPINSSELKAELYFIDGSTDFDISLQAFLSAEEVIVYRVDNGHPSLCPVWQQMMCYPASDFLTWNDHSIIFKIKLSDIDFNLDGNRIEAKVLNTNGEDITAGVTLQIDNSYLSSVTATWSDEQPILNYIIPTQTITIDGFMSDWNNVEPVFLDRTDDVHGVPETNIENVFIAQDDDHYYFRFDLLEAPGVGLYEHPQVRIEVNCPPRDIYYFITAWLNPANVKIEDTKTFDWNDPDAGTIKEYPADYLAASGRSIEYRILKSDMGFDLNDVCLSAVAIAGGASDKAESVYVE